MVARGMQNSPIKCHLLLGSLALSDPWLDWYRAGYYYLQTQIMTNGVCYD